MVLSPGEGTNGVVKFRGEPLEWVTSFPYLGSVVTNSGSLAVELTSRIRHAGKSLRALNPVMSNKWVDARRKARLINIVVIPALLYGAETWALKRSDELRLEAFMNVLRAKVLGIPRYCEAGPIRNNRLSGAVKLLPPLATILAIKRLSFYSRLFDPRSGDWTRQCLISESKDGSRVGARVKSSWQVRIRLDARLLAGGAYEGSQLLGDLRDLGARGAKHKVRNLLRKLGKTRTLAMVSHSLTGTRPRLFTCPRRNCNRSFGRNAETLRHLREDHGRGVRPQDRGKPLKCTFAACRKAFKCEGWRARHMQIAHGVG
jgi:hypothetical protein